MCVCVSDLPSGVNLFLLSNRFLDKPSQSTDSSADRLHSNRLAVLQVSVCCDSVCGQRSISTTPGVLDAVEFNTPGKTRPFDPVERHPAKYVDFIIIFNFLLKLILKNSTSIGVKPILPPVFVLICLLTSN